jgi:cytoskeletal protein RodZ
MDARVLGEELKTKRNAMNLSLKEAENGTSIRMAYLKSIEEGDLAAIISPVYAEGFVKQYANYLQLDGDKLIKEHRELFVRSNDQTFDYGIGTLEVRENAGSSPKRFSLVLWLIIGAVVVGAAWLIFSKWGAV